MIDKLPYAATERAHSITYLHRGHCPGALQVGEHDDRSDMVSTPLPSMMLVMVPIAESTVTVAVAPYPVP
jgi:hypothetical protein